MARKTKTTKTTKTSKKSRKTKNTKSASVPETVTENVVVTETVTVTPPSVPSTTETTTTTTPEVSVEQALTTSFSGLGDRVKTVMTEIKDISRVLKTLQRTVTKEMKAAAKKSSRRSRKSGVKRAPSGFAKPAVISDQLCQFLCVPSGTEMARTEVTKHLTQYIKEHQLQDQANKRRIIPDEQLGQLLNVGPSDEVTYFNLQKYMKSHFPKSGTSTATTSA